MSTQGSPSPSWPRTAIVAWILCTLACGATPVGADAPDGSDGATASGTDPDDDGPDADGPDDDGSPTGTAAGSSTDDGTAGDDGDDAPGDETSTAGDADSGSLPQGCGGTAPAPGVSDNLPLSHDGRPRLYDLFVPTGYDPDVPAPLVLNFHGLLGSASQQAGLSQFNLAAEPHGMLVIYPHGIGSSFNGGTCCGDAFAEGVDDVGYARALVEHVSATMCIDPGRVYATGMSNGGHMAHRLACEAADVFAATASVTGVLTTPPQLCNPARPISVLDFHGDDDPIVPFGGTGIGFPAVPTMMADWAARNGCDATPQVTFDQGDMRCETWPGCDGGVETSLCVTAGGGHCWPGAATCSFGPVSDELSASETIATMFMSQTL